MLRRGPGARQQSRGATSILTYGINQFQIWGTMMQSSAVKFLFAAALLLLAQGSSRAATLQVEPVLIDVTAPGAASTVTLRN
jgi:hypothetical protein